MPGYSRASKYSQMDNQIFSTKAFAVLAESGRPMTIPEICIGDMALNHVTPQKMARVLNDLCDKGLVAKSKDKTKGRLVYATVGSLWCNQEGDD